MCFVPTPFPSQDMTLWHHFLNKWSEVLDQIRDVKRSPLIVRFFYSCFISITVYPRVVGCLYWDQSLYINVRKTSHCRICRETVELLHSFLYLGRGRGLGSFSHFLGHVDLASSSPSHACILPAWEPPNSPIVALVLAKASWSSTPRLLLLVMCLDFTLLWEHFWSF